LTRTIIEIKIAEDKLLKELYYMYTYVSIVSLDWWKFWLIGDRTILSVHNIFGSSVIMTNYNNDKTAAAATSNYYYYYNKVNLSWTIRVWSLRILNLVCYTYLCQSFVFCLCGLSSHCFDRLCHTWDAAANYEFLRGTITRQLLKRLHYYYRTYQNDILLTAK